MKLNCKAGDLAILIGSDMPENIGMIFEILSFNHLASAALDTPTWNVRTARPARTGSGALETEGTASDAYLRPISGLPITNDIDTEIPA